MVGVLDWLVTLTLGFWVAAELLLQLRQLLRSARTERTEWRSFALIVVAVGVGVRVALLLRHALPAADYGTQHVWLLAPVLVVAWAGVALRLWSIITLGRFFRGTVHIQQGHRVVSNGPYRVLRHPSYSGMLLGGAALAVLLGNAVSWAVLALCVALALAYRIRVEERVLRAALGTAYEEYAARTRRLVPGVW